MEGYYVFNFRINLNKEYSNANLKELYDLLHRLFVSSLTPFIAKEKAFESLQLDQKKYVVEESTGLINQFLYDNKGAIKIDRDESDSISFYINKNNFNIINISGPEEDYKISLNVRSEGLKIEGIIENKFLFRMVSGDGALDENIFLIDSNRISYLTNFKMA